MRNRRWVVSISLALAALAGAIASCGDDAPSGGGDDAGASSDVSSAKDSAANDGASNDGASNDGALADGALTDGGGDGGADGGDAGHAWVYFAGGSTGSTFLGFAWEPSTRTLTALDGGAFTSGGGPIGIAAVPSGTHVYTANFLGDSVCGFSHDATSGQLTRIAVNPDGGLDLPVGVDPVFIAADPKGRCLYVARQSAPALDALTIGANGVLTLARETTTAAIAQWIAVDPAARFLLVGGTGGQVTIHKLDATTGLPLSVDGGVGGGTAYTTPANAFQVVVRADGLAAYIASPNTNEVRAFAIDPVALTLTPLATTTDAGFPLAIGVDPAGKFLYTANTAVDVRPIADSGTLGAATDTEPGGGQCFGMSFAPDGKTLFGHCSPGMIVPIDPTTGAMSAHTTAPFGQSRAAAWVVR